MGGTPLAGLGECPEVCPLNNYVGKFKMDASKTGDVKNNYFDEVFKAYPYNEVGSGPSCRTVSVFI